MHLLYRSNWRDAKKYMSYCNVHYLDNHILAKSTKLRVSKKEKSIANTRASNKKKSKKAQKK